MKSIILLATTLMFSTAVLSEVSVIVHPSNTASLDQKTIKKVFLSKSKKFSTGAQAVPIDSSATKAAFTKDVLGKSESQIKAYWSKLIFTGKGQAPKSVSSDADVIDLVSKNPSMIGYINTDAVTKAVKVVGKF